MGQVLLELSMTWDEPAASILPLKLWCCCCIYMPVDFFNKIKFNLANQVSG